MNAALIEFHSNNGKWGAIVIPRVGDDVTECTTYGVLPTDATVVVTVGPLEQMAKLAAKRSNGE